MLRKLKGFTLIELLIVIAIIAILTVAFLPTLRGSQAGARDAAKIALLTNLSVAFEKAINDGSPALPDDTAVAPNTTLGSGTCISSYAAAPGSTIATILGRVPQAFTAPAILGLCGGNGVWYNYISSTSYIFAMQVEEYKNANVEAGTAVTTLQAVNTVPAGVITVTDGAMPTSATTASPAAPFLYIIAKGA